MGKLRQGVSLIHELRQRRRAEKFLYRRGNGADVYQGLRGNNVKILKGHALTDNALHAAKADLELILQELTDASDAAVAEMVYIVSVSDAVGKSVQIVDGSKNIVNENVLGNENVYVFPYRGL